MKLPFSISRVAENDMSADAYNQIHEAAFTFPFIFAIPQIRLLDEQTKDHYIFANVKLDFSVPKSDAEVSLVVTLRYTSHHDVFQLRFPSGETTGK